MQSTLLKWMCLAAGLGTFRRFAWWGHSCFVSLCDKGLCVGMWPLVLKDMLDLSCFGSFLDPSFGAHQCIHFLLELIHPANSKEHIRKNEYNNIAIAALWIIAMCQLKCIQHVVKTVDHDELFDTVPFDEVDKVIDTKSTDQANRRSNTKCYPTR